MKRHSLNAQFFLRAIYIALVLLFSACKSNSTAEQLSFKPPVTTPDTQVISFSEISSSQILIKGGAYTSVSWPYLTGQAAVVSLHGSIDGGTTWTLLEPHVANSGLFVFHAPAIDSSNYLLKVMDGSFTVAISQPIHIVSSPPKLMASKFASLTEITKEEFTANMTSVYDPPANPTLSGKTWTIDFTNLVDAPIGFSVSPVVSNSQHGGLVSCINQVCSFQAPSAQMPQDQLQFRFKDPVGNESGIIYAYVDLGYSSTNSSSGIGLDANAVNADKDTVAAKIPGLLPGDMLVLAPGYYSPMDFKNIYGTALKPIIIVSQDRNNPAIIRDENSGPSLIAVGESSYLTFRFLYFDGLNSGATDGIKSTLADSISHHITVENCSFVNFGTNQTPIKIANTAWNWLIRSNTFNYSKAGIVLGDTNVPVVSSVIESNHFKRFSQPAIKSLAYSSHPSESGFPSGNLKNTIRNNVFDKFEKRAEPYPMILLEKSAGTDLYELYGNLFADQAASEPFVQIHGRASVHHNLFVKGTTSTGVLLTGSDFLLGHVFQNTFLDVGTGIKIKDTGASSASKVRGNLFLRATATVTLDNALGTHTGTAVNISLNDPDVAANTVNPDTTQYYLLNPLDMFPTTAVVTGADIVLADFSSTSNIDYDFNGYQNKGTYYGAYSVHGSNPGWKLASSIKQGGAFPSVNGSLAPSPMIADSEVKISIANTNDECPTAAPDANTIRICNSEDVSAACPTGNPNVLKPNESGSDTAKLNSWKTKVNEFISDKLTTGKTLEIMYSATATNLKAPYGTKPAYGRNFFAGCDIKIPASASNVTIKGVCSTNTGKRPTFFYDSNCAVPTGRRAIIHNEANNVKFINLNFINAKASTGNDLAAILDSGTNTSIAYSVFYKNNYGYVSHGGNTTHTPERKSTVYIKNSLFEKNGESSDKKSSGIDAGKGVTHLVVEDSLILRQKAKGSEINSAAQQTTIKCSVISGRSPQGKVAQEQTLWQDESLISFPYGGRANLKYNSIYKGSGTLNGYQFIMFNAENKDPSLLNFHQDLKIENSHFYNLMNSATPAFLINYNQRDTGQYSQRTAFSLNGNVFFGLENTKPYTGNYSKARFFNLQSGMDLSWDITIDSQNKIITTAIIPDFIDSTKGAQFVTVPGWDQAAHTLEYSAAAVPTGYGTGPGLTAAKANCPNFLWLSRGLPD